MVPCLHLKWIEGIIDFWRWVSFTEHVHWGPLSCCPFKTGPISHSRVIDKPSSPVTQDLGLEANLVSLGIYHMVMLSSSDPICTWPFHPSVPPRPSPPPVSVFLSVYIYSPSLFHWWLWLCFSTLHLTSASRGPHKLINLTLHGPHHIP